MYSVLAYAICTCATLLLYFTNIKAESPLLSFTICCVVATSRNLGNHGNVYLERSRLKELTLWIVVVRRKRSTGVAREQQSKTNHHLAVDDCAHNPTTANRFVDRKSGGINYSDRSTKKRIPTYSAQYRPYYRSHI